MNDVFVNFLNYCFINLIGCNFGCTIIVFNNNNIKNCYLYFSCTLDQSLMIMMMNENFKIKLMLFQNKLVENEMMIGEL